MKSLSEVKETVEKILKEDYKKKAEINIHYSTMLKKEDALANVQGAGRYFDILISGDLELEKILEAVAHEVAHIVKGDHSVEWLIEKEKILNKLKSKISDNPLDKKANL